MSGDSAVKCTRSTPRPTSGRAEVPARSMRGATRSVSPARSRRAPLATARNASRSSFSSMSPVTARGARESMVAALERRSASRPLHDGCRAADGRPRSADRDGAARRLHQCARRQGAGAGGGPRRARRHARSTPSESARRVLARSHARIELRQREVGGGVERFDPWRVADGERASRTSACSGPTSTGANGLQVEAPGRRGVPLEAVAIDPELLDRVGVDVVELDGPQLVVRVGPLVSAALTVGPHGNGREALDRRQARHALRGDLPGVETAPQPERAARAVDVRGLEAPAGERAKRDVELDRRGCAASTRRCRPGCEWRGSSRGHGPATATSRARSGRRACLGSCVDGHLEERRRQEQVDSDEVRDIGAGHAEKAKLGDHAEEVPQPRAGVRGSRQPPCISRPSPETARLAAGSRTARPGTHGIPHRELRFPQRPPRLGARLARRVDRLALHAALRLGRLHGGPARARRARVLDHVPARARPARRATLSSRHV